MLVDMVKVIRTALSLFIVMLVVTGMIYPAMVTAVAQAFFPWRANGSLIQQGNKVIGSELIGQQFSKSEYFWGRESATMPFPYTAKASAGSNFGPSYSDLYARIRYRVNTLHTADPSNVALIPSGLVTASGSGLDPDISPAAALYQVHRVAMARKIPENILQDLIMASVQKRWAGVLGEPRVNVLRLNLTLDAIGEGEKYARPST